MDQPLSRRHRAVRRNTQPDPRYGNEELSRFINRVMIGGKKSIARRAVYEALEMLGRRLNMDPLEAFQQAMSNATPLLEVRPRRIGGATYQVPIEVRPERREALAQRWVVNAARSRQGQPIARKLFTELVDAANNTGAAVGRKQELQRMAEANRAYAHFRW